MTEFCVMPLLSLVLFFHNGPAAEKHVSRHGEQMAPPRFLTGKLIDLLIERRHLAIAKQEVQRLHNLHNYDYKEYK